MAETFDEQWSRVRQMAGGDPTWDLSDNDKAALTAVLARVQASDSELEQARDQARAERERADTAQWHLATFIAPIERLVVVLAPTELGAAVEPLRPALEKARAAVSNDLLDRARADIDAKARAALQTTPSETPPQEEEPDA